MGSTSPTQRSLALLERRGYTAGVVEKWIPMPSHPAGGIRRDLAGGIDIVAWKVGSPFLGVQACAGSGLASHRDKLLDEPRMRDWVASGGSLVIWAWRTLVVVKKDGTKGKARRWACNEVELRLEDFATDPAPATFGASPAGR